MSAPPQPNRVVNALCDTPGHRLYFHRLSLMMTLGARR
jgi:hypothetical protein